MSSPSATPLALFQAQAIYSPLPDSRPDSPATEKSGEFVHKSSSPEKQQMHAGIVKTPENTSQDEEVASADDEVSETVSIKTESTESKFGMGAQDPEAGAGFCAANAPVGGGHVSTNGEDDGINTPDMGDDGVGSTLELNSDSSKRSLSPVHEKTIELQLNKNTKDEDTRLYVRAKAKNGYAYKFEVDFAMIGNGSPVFYDMVYNTHRKRDDQEQWIWELEDSPVGLKVMFSILHLSMPISMIAQAPKSEHIYDVLCVLDRYKVENATFYPWAQNWIVGFRSSLVDTTLSPLECLYVAHKLGDFKSLKLYLRKVAHELEVCDDGQLRLGNGKLPQDVVPIKDDMVAAINEARVNDLEALLKPLTVAHDFLINPGNFDERRFCVSVDHHRECNQKLLGSLVTSLLSQGLFPIPKPDGVKGKVNDLATKILAMEIRGLYFPGLAPHEQRHGLCRLGQDDVAKKIVKCEAYLPLPDHLVEHMYFTGRRVGIHEDEKKEFHDYEGLYHQLGQLYKHEQTWAWDDHECANGGDDCVSSGSDSGIGDDSPRATTRTPE